MFYESRAGLQKGLLCVEPLVHVNKSLNIYSFFKYYHDFFDKPGIKPSEPKRRRLNLDNLQNL